MNNQQLDGVAVRLKALERDVDRLKALDRPNATALLRGNYIINGSFKVSQRYVATARTLPVATVDYTLDQVRCNVNGTGPVIAVSQQAHAVGGDGIPGAPTNFLRWNQTTAGTGTTVATIDLPVESVATLSNQLVTFSLWMKADTNGRQVTLSIVQFFGSGGSPTAAVFNLATTFSLTTSWVRYSITGFLSDITGSTLGTAGNDCLLVRLTLPNNAVQTLDFSQAQLEGGGAATGFRLEAFDEVLKKCQRYYEKSFDYSIAPTDGSGSAAGEIRFSQQVAAATSQFAPYIQFKVQKRATPTVVLFNPSASGAGANGQIRNDSRTSNCTASAANSPGLSGSSVFFTTAVGSTANDFLAFHWTAEANIV